jgi:hypothetical protein
MNVFITSVAKHPDLDAVLRGVIASAYFQRHTVLVSTACPQQAAIELLCDAWQVACKPRASSFQGKFDFTDADTSAVLSADSVLLLYLGDAADVRLERIRRIAAQENKPVLYRRSLRTIQFPETAQIIRFGGMA